MEKQEIKKEKKMTIDDLAGMMTKGFESVYKEIAEGREETNGLAIMVAKGFDRIEKRFDTVEGRLGKVEERLDGVEERLENVEEGVQSVRGSILDLGDRTVQRYEFEDLRTRFDGLEQKVK